MAVYTERYREIISELDGKAVLVAVSKIRTVEEIKQLYNLGQRDFGENYVQELVDKQSQLPGDIHWHFIGHMQSNKVKYIAPFVHLLQGVDSFKLLKEINKQAVKYKRNIDILFQVHIAQEETKFGMNEQELKEAMSGLLSYPNVRVLGLMGMASFSDNLEKVRNELRYLKALFDRYQTHSGPNCRMEILSMGMSGDYKLALEEGSNMVRIGSLIFGSRN